MKNFSSKTRNYYILAVRKLNEKNNIEMYLLTIKNYLLEI